MYPSKAASVSIHAQIQSKAVQTMHCTQFFADTYCRRTSLVLSECTCERKPELIQLVLAKLADMVEACCASCMEPDRA